MTLRARIISILFLCISGSVSAAPIDFVYKTQPFSLSALSNWERAYLRGREVPIKPHTFVGRVFEYTLTVDCSLVDRCPRFIAYQLTSRENYIGPFFTSSLSPFSDTINISLGADFESKDFFRWSIGGTEGGGIGDFELTSDGDFYRPGYRNMSPTLFYCIYTFDEVVSERNPNRCQSGQLIPEYTGGRIPFGQGRWFVDGEPIDPIPVPPSLPLLAAGLLLLGRLRQRS